MSKVYQSKIDRRTTLKWLGSAAAISMLPACSDSGSVDGGSEVIATDGVLNGNVSPWSDAKVKPVSGPGYGTDPKLTKPEPAPWERTLTPDQLNLVAILSDIIIPADDVSPAATQVGVPDFIDEWVSAPYPNQQRDRELVIAGLDWLSTESARRFQMSFVNLPVKSQLEIVDNIAYKTDDSEFQKPTQFFDKMRSLVTGAFYSSPEGMTDIGYMGNVPINGDYPGPTPAARTHLQAQLKKLSL